jgi:hypothetical protein
MILASCLYIQVSNMQRLLGWALCKRFVSLPFAFGLLLLIILLSSLLSIGITSSYRTRHLSSSRLLKSSSGSKSPSTTIPKDSDISKMKMEPGGLFKRADASFCNTIEKGSQFEPEIGEFRCFMFLAKKITFLFI